MVTESSEMTDSNGQDNKSIAAGPGHTGFAMASSGSVFGSSEAPGGPKPKRARPWRRVGIVMSVLLAAVVIGGFTYQTPYVALIPGSARDTEPLIELSGIDEFPSDGELLFTTVRLRTRPNLWHYLWLQLDDDNEIVPEDVILGDRSPDENRELNLQAMTDSIGTAVAVALEELGYDAISSDGVFIVEVVEGGAAEGVLTPGDVVVAMDGAPMVSALELVDRLKGLAPGDEIVLTVERYRPTGEGALEIEDLRISLGAKPDDENAAFLGVAPQTRIQFADDLPFEISIDSGSVGGPSAGLVFALAVLDQLTPGELTGGAQVAVTGSISPDGRVGSVGGVLQKTAAVRDLGAEVFIIPAALGEEAIAQIRLAAGDDLEIIPVETLDEALEALASLGGNTEAIEEFAAANP